MERSIHPSRSILLALDSRVCPELLSVCLMQMLIQSVVKAELQQHARALPAAAGNGKPGWAARPLHGALGGSCHGHLGHFHDPWEQEGREHGLSLGQPWARPCQGCTFI